jgi:hypothetical protein
MEPVRRVVQLLLIAAAIAAAFLLGRRAQQPDPSVPIDETARAWDRVHSTPNDPAGWSNLGDAQANAGDLVGAEHAYLTAIRMGGDNALAYARLGFLHYERGEDDRALALLVEAKQRGASVPMLEYTIDALKKRDAKAEPIEEPIKRAQDAGIAEEVARAPELDASVPEPEPPEEVIAEQKVIEPPPPPAPAHDGVCSIPVQRLAQGRTFVVPIAVYGHWANLIIDTGASITVVTDSFADAVRLPRDPSAVVRAITANGRVEFGTAVVPEVVLANRVAENVRVAVCDDCVESVADGLLGLDLVAAFGMRLDLANATVHFADCE